MRSLVLVLYFAFNVSLAISGTIDPSVPDEKYVSYGKKFECVVQIHGEYTNGVKFRGSAVAIKPNWIVTAAHVVSDYKTVSISDKKEKDHDVSIIIIHKDFEIDIMGKADIALCYIEDPIDISFFPQLYSESNEVGKICSMAGFGVTGNFNTGSNKMIIDGKKRAGSNFIDKVDKDLLICSPSPIGSEDRTSLEYLTATGDSGGGLFIDQKLAGIHSIVIAEDLHSNSDYGDESGHTRVSVYKEWIEENTKNGESNEK